MSEHHALGEARGARRVHDHADVVGVGFGKALVVGRLGQDLAVVEPAVCAALQDDAVLHRRDVVAKGRDCLRVPASYEEDLRPAVVDHVAELVRPRPEVQGYEDGVKLGGGERDFDVLGAVDLQHGDPVACLDAKVRHRVGQPIYVRLQLGVGLASAFEYCRRPIRDDGRRYCQKIGEVHSLVSRLKRA